MCRRLHNVEQVKTDLKGSALVHMPSIVFAANRPGSLPRPWPTTSTRAAGPFRKARTGRIRRKLIHIPARIAISARRIRLHPPGAGPWQTPRQDLFDQLYPSPQAA